MLIVGLTGGIATGKSTVSTRLAENHNLTIIDADLIAKEVVQPGKNAYTQIVKTFADVEDLINDDKSLNRAALGSAVFGNKEKLSKLNSIVHPAVKKEIVWRILSAYFRLERLVILDVPLLFESGLDMVCGLTISVSSSDKLQIERLLNRNPELSREDAEKRISSQMPSSHRNYRADIVIENNSDVASLRKEVDHVVKAITPGLFRTVLEYFPPVGIFAAVLYFTLRQLRDRFRGYAPKQKED